MYICANSEGCVRSSNIFTYSLLLTKSYLKEWQSMTLLLSSNEAYSIVSENNYLLYFTIPWSYHVQAACSSERVNMNNRREPTLKTHVRHAKTPMRQTKITCRTSFPSSWLTTALSEKRIVLALYFGRAIFTKMAPSMKVCRKSPTTTWTVTLMLLCNILYLVFINIWWYIQFIHPTSWF